MLASYADVRHAFLPTKLDENFKILQKCPGKLECLVQKMLIIKDKRPIYAKHSSGLQPSENFHLIIICPFSRFNLHARFALSFSINITTNHVNFSSLDNDDMKPSKRQVSFISLFLFQIKLIELAILTNQRFFKRNALSIFLFGFVTQAFESTTTQNDFCFLSI